MELIRQDTDYALRAITSLALARDGENATAMDLAKSQGIPISFGHKILRKLVAAHLVTSRAGRSGGFRLARRPETIRLIDIVTAIQGPVSVSRCMMEINPCLRRATCPVSQKWRKLQRSIITFLRTTTLADIIGAK